MITLWYLRFTADDNPFGILDLQQDTKAVIISRKSKIPKGLS
jgi:hypothetical protein